MPAGRGGILSEQAGQAIELLDAILAALDRSADDGSPSGAVGDRRSLAGASSQTTPLSLLLVEDNETNQMLAVTLLEKAGPRGCNQAYNGKDALDILSEQAVRRNTSMDVQMPEMDGLEAVQRVFESRSERLGEARPDHRHDGEAH